MDLIRNQSQAGALALALILLLGAAGCKGQTTTPAQLAPTQPPTITPIPPTATPVPEPLAARVNEEAILLAEYQVGLKQIQEAGDSEGQVLSAEEQSKRVLDDLVEQTLLAQAAREAGHTVDDAALQTRLDEMAGQMGGAAALTDWQTRYGYTDALFRSALRRSMEAAWQRDQIAAQVPQTAEQVHARQILVLNESTAQSVQQQVKAGADFATLAYQYDPIVGGDLGWFPKGYLTQPDVEAAAFALQPGQVSETVKTSFGYHIIQVIERDAQHPLSTDARRKLQRKAVQDWLEQRHAESKIEILLP